MNVQDTMTLDERAAYRVLRARSALIKARRFYSVLVSHVEPVISSRVPTAATNGKQHFWNADFVSKLDADELEGVQAHETEHDARHHSTRRGNRDPLEWNIACDLAINPDLIAEGFKLPKDALLDKRFAGMSAEDIYRTRELDKQRDQPQPQPPQPPEDEPESDDEGDDEGDDAQQPNESKGDEPKGDDGDGESDEQSNDEESDDGEGDGEGDADEESEDEGEGGNADGESSDEGEGEGEGKGAGSGQADGEGEDEPTFSGDVGQCGEVLDAPAESASENAAQDQEWERIVRQAASMAKAVGQLPGHVSADIEAARTPGQDWRETLRAFFDQGSLRVETWNRPNRRFVGGGLYMPGNQRDGLNRVVFLIDTSGSMDRVALELIKNETQTALDDGVIDDVTVVYGDTQVNRVDTWHTGDEMVFDPRGGGGTRLRPLFDYARDEVSDASLIVCFTDMEFEDLNSTEEPACPVLFAATGYPDRVRQYLANAPWGAPGIDVGAH